jgi:hypothetical protein
LQPEQNAGEPADALMANDKNVLFGTASEGGSGGDDRVFELKERDLPPAPFDGFASTPFFAE